MSIKINSICFNQDGDPAAGSLHCRVDGNKPIPPRFELGAGLSPVGVFVPSALGPNIPIAVSYTHLDVYKRQAKGGVQVK